MGYPSQRIRKLASLPDQVYEYLRGAIIRGELLPGEKLIELEIAAQMGTSQGPVREALQRLERDGLVEHRARSATYVTRISSDEMYELFAIRSVIEGYAIERTAQTISPDQCIILDDLIGKMVAAGRQGELPALAEYDMQFHRRIVEWSGSGNYLGLWTPLSNQIQRFIVASHPQHFPDFVEVAIRHQPIVEALRCHQVTAAVRAVQEHIMLIWHRIDHKIVPAEGSSQ